MDEVPKTEVSRYDLDILAHHLSRGPLGYMCYFLNIFLMRKKLILKRENYMMNSAIQQRFLLFGTVVTIVLLSMQKSRAKQASGEIFFKSIHPVSNMKMSRNDIIMV